MMWTRFVCYGVPGASQYYTTVLLKSACFGLSRGANSGYPLYSSYVLWECVCCFSQQRRQGCDVHFRGSSGRARFCTDVEAGMGREYGVWRLIEGPGAI